MFEHRLSDVIQSQPEICSSLVFAVGDANTDLGLDVYVGLDGRGKPNLSGSRIELQEVGVIAVSEVVLQLARRVGI